MQSRGSITLSIDWVKNVTRDICIKALVYELEHLTKRENLWMEPCEGDFISHNNYLTMLRATPGEYNNCQSIAHWYHGNNCEFSSYEDNKAIEAPFSCAYSVTFSLLLNCVIVDDSLI